MNYPPIPCAHCGTNFMRHNLDPEAPKICNNCVIRERDREKTLKKPGVKDMSKIQIMIEFDPKTQVEVEELCMNRGISYSQYFLQLHEDSKVLGRVVKEEEVEKSEDGKYVKMKNPEPVKGTVVESVIVGGKKGKGAKS